MARRGWIFVQLGTVRPGIESNVRLMFDDTALGALPLASGAQAVLVEAEEWEPVKATFHARRFIASKWCVIGECDATAALRECSEHCYEGLTSEPPSVCIQPDDYAEWLSAQLAEAQHGKRPWDALWKLSREYVWENGQQNDTWFDALNRKLETPLREEMGLPVTEEAVNAA